MNTEQTMQIAPIPPYFVYDGFENDLDAVLILERIMSVSSTMSNMFTHLQFFARLIDVTQRRGQQALRWEK